jgi:hypothetical protein
MAFRRGKGQFHLCRKRTPFVDEGKILAAHAAHTPGVLSDRALRRRQTFPSKAAALKSYTSKPTFRSFHPAALSAYVEHGFRELPSTHHGLPLKHAQHTFGTSWRLRMAHKENSIKHDEQAFRL